MTSFMLRGLNTRLHDIRLRCHLVLGFCYKPDVVGPHAFSGYAPLGSNHQHTQGNSPSQGDRLNNLAHSALELRQLSQVSGRQLHQVTGMMVSCHAIVPLCMFHLCPLSMLLRDHFDMLVDHSSKLIPLSSLFGQTVRLSCII